MAETGQAVLLDHLCLALDERQRVVDKIVRHMVAVRGDPLAREFLFKVRDVGELEQLCSAGIAVGAVALEADHVVGRALEHLLDGGLAGHKGFLDVGAGGAVRGAALQQRELDAADLGAGLFLHDVGERRGEAAQLGVAEAVGRGGLGLGDEAAVGVVDALGHGDDAVVLLLVAGGDVGDELVQIKVDLGQVDEIDAVLFFVRERGGGGQPAGVAAHALDDRDHAGVVDLGVARDFHDGGGDVLGGGGVARAVVGAVEVVVDRLGHAHDAAFVADLLHILGDLVAGVHGVIAAVVAEIADIILFEDFEDALVVGVIDIGVRDLVAAGAERGGRGIGEQRQLGGVLFVHDHEFVVEHALDAVVCAVDLGDGARVESGTDNTVGGCVDDGRRAARLTDNERAFEFCCHIHTS